MKRCFIYYSYDLIYYLKIFFHKKTSNINIPFIFQAAALLAAFTHPSHIVIYAPGDSFTCRRAATRNLLDIEVSQ
ncbi:hypothetical protein C5468_07035 [Photorhabdus luminescens subsp. mexicana]|uniref:Uncharacterized protein n=1 Tax=Photorhabdus luminescens subsp. mexicana TaxID=2100167 RepID=A0A4R4JGW8_PHOLU|nr:hypothetical protein C5468_07035 [Photorhabdus luminescens subsp. mexicana]